MYNQEPVNHIRSWVEPTAHTYHIRIDRDIEEVSRFQEEILQIRQATENDRVHLYINSNGGYLSTLGSILSAIEQSSATICCELELDAHSAASFIFLSGDEFIISDNASMMIHELQGGVGGTTANTKKQVDHLAKQNEKLIRKYYKHFLTKEEIENVLKGQEIYLDADEIMERLKKRKELFDEELAEAEENQLSEIDELFGAELTREQLECLDKETLIKILAGELSEDEERALFNVEDIMGYSAEKDEASCVDIEELSLPQLKAFATQVGVKFPHNIGRDTLIKKLNNLQK